MYVLLTVETLYYNNPLRTFATYADAFNAGCKLAGWWLIERVL